MTPASNAARATTTLNVEPGEYCPEIALLVKGVLSSYSKASQFYCEMPSTNKLGSNEGTDTEANISPV